MARESERTHYRNGDKVESPKQGCDECTIVKSLVGIETVAHEAGCTLQWKDWPRLCTDCGKTFFSKGGHESCVECDAEKGK
jgi:predicted amidophosphoribosyltransferase